MLLLMPGQFFLTSESVQRGSGFTPHPRTAFSFPINRTQSDIKSNAHTTFALVSSWVHLSKLKTIQTSLFISITECE